MQVGFIGCHKDNRKKKKTKDERNAYVSLHFKIAMIRIWNVLCKKLI